jgi:hypothetical protein
MRSVYHNSFIAPTGGGNFLDGRQFADAAIKKAHRSGPQSPASLAKRARSDADVNRDVSMTLTKGERLRRSNAPDALQAIKKIHGKGSRRSLDEAQGDAPVGSRSVSMVKAARRIGLRVNGHRLLSANELNTEFAKGSALSKHPINIDIVDRTVTAGKYDYDFDAKGIVLAKRLNARYRKGLGTARPRANDVGVTDNYGHGAPESLNGDSGGAIADTGASNSWRDQAVPNVKPTQVGTQFLGNPSLSDILQSMR